MELDETEPYLHADQTPTIGRGQQSNDCWSLCSYNEVDMSFPYDARSPFTPGSVLSVPRPKVSGLTMAQVKAARNSDGKTPPFHRGGPFSLGMVSTVRASRSELTPIPTRPVFNNRTPGRKRSTGRSKRGPENHVFQGANPTNSQKFMAEADMMLKELRSIYRQLLTDMNFDEQKYEGKRNHFLLMHRTTHQLKLERMETWESLSK